MSFSAGAPLSSCTVDLSPRHGFAAQTGTPPVEIVLDKDTISHMEYLRVTIRSSQAFKGYLVRAVDRNISSLGSWYIPHYDLTSQYLHCGEDRPQSSVTHTSLTISMYELYLQWKPSHNYHGKVNIVATIVMNYTTYWTGVTSRPVIVIGDGDDQDDMITESDEVEDHMGKNTMDAIIQTQFRVGLFEGSGEEIVEEENVFIPQKDTKKKALRSFDYDKTTTYKSVLLEPPYKNLSNSSTIRRSGEEDVPPHMIAQPSNRTKVKSNTTKTTNAYWWRKEKNDPNIDVQRNDYGAVSRTIDPEHSTTYKSVLIMPKKTRQG
jgi:hypothetical protein